jgi:hypothetical protein
MRPLDRARRERRTGSVVETGRREASNPLSKHRRWSLGSARRNFSDEKVYGKEDPAPAIPSARKVRLMVGFTPMDAPPPL